MTATTIVLIISLYFALMFIISWFSSRKTSNATFFNAARQSNWLLVAIAMIGASMSGVSFISVPGMVGNVNFSYLQMCIGFFCAYLLIAYVLIPLYYRLGLISIYEYLERRFGRITYKSGACFFFISKVLGASLRLFIVCITLQLLVFDPLGLSFVLNAFLNILLVLAYTFRAGVKTLIWTDIIKTTTMIASIVLCIVFIARDLSLDFSSLVSAMHQSPLTRVFVFDDVNSPQFFLKQFFGGLFMVVAMTGLDQDMMQRSLSCRNHKEAQKNLVISSLLQIVVIFLFLSLGFVLYLYAAKMGLQSAGDKIFPTVATSGNLPDIVAIMFVLGLVSCAYSSAGSSLTSLTSSFTIDIIGTKGKSEAKVAEQRKKIHIFMAILLFLCILMFRYYNDRSIIDATYMLASYTYAPLLALFAFGILCKRRLREGYVPVAILVSLLIGYVFQSYSKQWFNGYVFSYELLILNALICIVAFCLLIKKKGKE